MRQLAGKFGTEFGVVSHNLSIRSTRKILLFDLKKKHNEQKDFTDVCWVCTVRQEIYVYLF